MKRAAQQNLNQDFCNLKLHECFCSRKISVETPEDEGKENSLICGPGAGAGAGAGAGPGPGAGGSVDFGVFGLERVGCFGLKPPQKVTLCLQDVILRVNPDH